MTEPPEDGRLTERLHAWFDSEVRRAERDVQAQPTMPALRRTPRARVSAAVASMTAVVVAVVALSTLIRALDRGTTPTTPPASAAAATSASPSAQPAIAFGADGIPVQIEGEPVLTVSAAGLRLSAATDDTPFLVGGVVTVQAVRCLLISDPVARPLLDSCGVAIRDPDSLGPSRLTISPDGGRVQPGLAVLRVHTHDPRASDCAPSMFDRCDSAVVVDDVVWTEPRPGDGDMPTEIAGQPVLDPAQALQRAAEATAPESFLVGGTAERLRKRCEFRDGAHGENLLLGCRLLGIRAGDSLAEITSDRVLFDEGPIVLKIHVADPRASVCEAETRLRCRRALVADEVLWPREQVLGRGFPTQLGGEPVLSPAEATEIAGRPGPMPDTLVAGTIDRSTVFDCLAPAPALGFGCPDFVLSGRPGPIAPAGFGLLAVRLDAWVPQVGRVVARVHSNDRAATGCPAETRRSCEDQVVVDAIVWVDPAAIDGRRADGSPATIGGTPLDLPSEVPPLADGGQRAVSGWVGDCLDTSSCAAPAIRDTPLGGVPLLLSGDIAIPTGPVVVVVEADPDHPTSAACPVGTCVQWARVVALLWTGGAEDPATR